MLAGTRSFSSFDHPGCKAKIPGAPKGYVVQVVRLNVAGGRRPHKPLCPLPRRERCWYIRNMGSTPHPSIANLPSAFAAACRLSRTEGELFERCRVALVRRFQSERIWLSITSPTEMAARVGPSVGFEGAAEVARLSSGQTEVAIHADPLVAEEMRSVAMPLALGHERSYRAAQHFA